MISDEGAIAHEHNERCLMTIKEVCRIIPYQPQTVSRWTRGENPKLQAIRSGNGTQTLICKLWLREFLDARTTTPRVRQTAMAPYRPRFRRQRANA